MKKISAEKLKILILFHTCAPNCTLISERFLCWEEDDVDVEGENYNEEEIPESAINPDKKELVPNVCGGVKWWKIWTWDYLDQWFMISCFSLSKILHVRLSNPEEDISRIIRIMTSDMIWKSYFSMWTRQIVKMMNLRLTWSGIYDLVLLKDVSKILHGRLFWPRTRGFLGYC